MRKVQGDERPNESRVQVRVVASLPCYSKDNVDAQRGGGVFARSVAGLQQLNAAGYGRAGTGLLLDLVYNPNGLFLAPPQATLEPAYKQELAEAYGIEFNSLLCLNNMPIKRYWEYLQRRGELEAYTKLLVDNCNPDAAEHVMCRDTVSVAWDGRMCATPPPPPPPPPPPRPRSLCCALRGRRLLRLLTDCQYLAVRAGGVAAQCLMRIGAGRAALPWHPAHLVCGTLAARSCDWCGPVGFAHLSRDMAATLAEPGCGGCRYDCDFNQQLALQMQGSPDVFSVESLDELTARPIACGSHCFGCTAGSGSSCQGQ